MGERPEHIEAAESLVFLQAELSREEKMTRFCRLYKKVKHQLQALDSRFLATRDEVIANPPSAAKMKEFISFLEVREKLARAIGHMEDVGAEWMYEEHIRDTLPYQTVMQFRDAGILKLVMAEKLERREILELDDQCVP